MRKYFSLPVIVTLLIIAGIIIWMVVSSRPASLPPESPSAGTGGLKVDSSGGQIFSGVSASELQQAAPPTKSATSSELNPQQTSPNFCAPGEAPYLDGCIPSQ
ncbi:MAG TPA: hypothetical protein VFP35_01685 [Candidatus Saccharimonadales bacterium]|nr:hypothetical protein [Candidatus Saccharimonadales bacterium]